MADGKQLNLLKQGVETWNQWRSKHPTIFPRLQHANLNNLDLDGINLINANLSFADLSFSNLSRADLRNSDLSEAKFRGARFNETNLCGANLSSTDLTYANFTNADLTRTHLINTNLTKSVLTNVRVYGISVWDVQAEGAWQNGLTITSSNQPTITVENLEIAQFVHLLLNNRKAIGVIDTISTKIVLVFGNFLPERKLVADAIISELRRRNYLPILFNFDQPRKWRFTAMLSTLAHLSYFIIADFTDASIPLELQRIISNLGIPVQPFIPASKHTNATFDDLTFYRWVLPIYRYESTDELLSSLNEHIIEPSERKAANLR